jgi:drug/metabolite transporter (DMT)-like permease
LLALDAGLVFVSIGIAGGRRRDIHAGFPGNIARPMNAPHPQAATRTGALVAAFAILYGVWGSTYLAIRVAIGAVPPFLMAGTRFLAAGAVLYALARLRGAASPTKREWGAGALCGALLMLIGNGTVTWAEQAVPSGTVALIVATVSLWITLFDWLFFGGPRPTPRMVVGIALGLVGVGVLVDAAAGGPVWGMLALVGSSACWAVGTLWSRRGRLPASPLMASSLQMLTGGTFLVLLGTATGEARTLDLAAVGADAWTAMAYLALLGSVVTFSVYTWLVRNASPAAVGTYGFVNPMVAVLLGSVFLHEPVTARTGVAAACIVGAVMLVIWRRR